VLVGQPPNNTKVIIYLVCLLAGVRWPYTGPDHPR